MLYSGNEVLGVALSTLRKNVVGHKNCDIKVKLCCQKLKYRELHEIMIEDRLV